MFGTEDFVFGLGSGGVVRKWKSSSWVGWWPVEPARGALGRPAGVVTR